MSEVIVVTESDVLVINDTATEVVEVTSIGAQGPAGVDLNRETIRLNALGLVSESFDRVFSGASGVTPLNQSLMASGVPLVTGQVVTTIIAHVIEGQAEITHAWFALYSPGYELLAQTADTPEAFSDGGLVALDCVSPYTVPVSGLYYAGLLIVTDGTVPAFGGAFQRDYGQSAAIVGGQIRGGYQTDVTALPDPADLTDSPELWFGIA